jgi:hypothetical protein
MDHRDREEVRQSKWTRDVAPGASGERWHSWTQSRRLARKFEQIIKSRAAWSFIASIQCLAATTQDHQIMTDNFGWDT